MSRILLSISYIASNAARARRTIEEFGTYFRRNRHRRCEVLLGVETRADQRVELARFASFFQAMYVWDEVTTTRAAKALARHPQPFASGFSYGGYVNRVLILSHIAGCDYLLRIDPGALPPEDLWTVIERQVAALQANRVVSGVYANRLAFRDGLYARRSTRDEYLAFIERQTGVNLKAQITGGALFMVASPGTPAIPFSEWSAGAPTLVWGSDDAIFQASGIESHVFAEHKVPRHDMFGEDKSPVEYFRGIAGMVYLNNLRCNNAARTSLGPFVRGLNEFLDPSLKENQGCRFPLEEEHLAPSRFLDCIDSGYANYQQLVSLWDEVVDDAKRAIPPETLMLHPL